MPESAVATGCLAVQYLPPNRVGSSSTGGIEFRNSRGARNNSFEPVRAHRAGKRDNHIEPVVVHMLAVQTVYIVHPVVSDRRCHVGNQSSSLRWTAGIVCAIDTDWLQ